MHRSIKSSRNKHRKKSLSYQPSLAMVALNEGEVVNIPIPEFTALAETKTETLIKRNKIKTDDETPALNTEEKDLLKQVTKINIEIGQYIREKNQEYKLDDIKFTVDTYLEWANIYKAAVDTLAAFDLKKPSSGCFSFWKSKLVYPEEISNFINFVKTYSKILSYRENPLIEDLPAIYAELSSVKESIPQRRGSIKPRFKGAVRV